MGDSVDVLMLGPGGAGKTSISLQYIRGEFSDTYVPTIEDDFSKTVKFGNKNYELNIIDTAGQDDFKDMRAKYLSRCSLFVIVYDVDDKNSYAAVKELIEDIRTHRGNNPFNIVVAANKVDIHSSSQGISAADAESEIRKYAPDVCVIETSAKLNKNIDALFEKVLELYVSRNNINQKSDGGCCKIQ